MMKNHPSNENPPMEEPDENDEPVMHHDEVKTHWASRKNLRLGIVLCLVVMGITFGVLWRTLLNGGTLFDTCEQKGRGSKRPHTAY
jgi:hypothetical protein